MTCMTSFNLNDLLRPRLQIQSHCGVQASTYEVAGETVQSRMHQSPRHGLQGPAWSGLLPVLQSRLFSSPAFSVYFSVPQTHRLLSSLAPQYMLFLLLEISFYHPPPSLACVMPPYSSNTSSRVFHKEFSMTPMWSW